MIKFETITIKSPKTSRNRNFVLKNNKVDKLLCSCGGKYTKSSECNHFVFDEENRTVTCPECGFKFYELSANIEYADWLKVKKHFKFYNRGWSNGQELEWDYGEPSGWLTTNPEAVEKILVESGLIKPENTMKAISEKVALEKEQKEKEFAKREKLSRNMEEIHAKINDQFIQCDHVRTLSDAEADEYYFKSDFGKGNVVTYTVTNTEIIQCRNMGDFKTGIAIPYAENLENLIKEFYELNDKFWEE